MKNYFASVSVYVCIHIHLGRQEKYQISIYENYQMSIYENYQMSI